MPKACPKLSTLGLTVEQSQTCAWPEYAEVLIDEADKAQPEFLGLLLEVLEEQRRNLLSQSVRSCCVSEQIHISVWA